MFSRSLLYFALPCILGACEDAKLEPPSGSDVSLSEQLGPSNHSDEADDAPLATPPERWDGPPVELDPLPEVWGGLGVLGLGGTDCISWFALGGEQVECDDCSLAFEAQLLGLDTTCGDISSPYGSVQLEVREEILWADGWELGDVTYGSGFLLFAGEEPWDGPYGYYGYLWY